MYHLFFVRLRTAMGMIPHEKTDDKSRQLLWFRL
jgi:hypothetical protein